MLPISVLDNENYRQISIPVSKYANDSPADSREVLRQIDVKYSSAFAH